MRKFAYILAVVILSFSFLRCTNEKKKNDQKNITELDSQIVKNSCKRILMNDVLFKCIDGYINDHSIMSPAQDWMYYSLLFFKENDKEYFTIWFFVVFPDIVISDQLDTAMYYYDMDIIQDRKVVFVTKKDMSSSIFKSTEDSRSFADHERNNRVSPSIYDGDWYFQTYEIIQNETNGYKLTKMDSANIFFKPSAEGLTKVPVVSSSKKKVVY
ncbi:MAG: hypothetical protein AB7V36_06705 [Bacteroidales bacterium]